ncbi:MAG: flagellar basal body-associated protein FliL [Bacillota bacterium]|uniref:flagellar basal body-associated protein FliL n=1 Tax=Bacillus sp. RO2 TaxID=2723913 RepID=UPI00145FBC9D|nr:flagellar basal body-associated protein FliL [Bacillus sp. RO2]MEA3320114.1 flagellar basal body-associated protein FliL [Bacillota bacterium]NMH74913.1 flagellar basal body-associated protein FliL [Bacillus sp. RO2]
MFRNKLLNIMIIILLGISLIGVVALVTVDKFYADKSTEDPTIDEIIKYSVDFEEITTNLQSGGYVRLKMKVQTDSKKATEELLKRDFQVQNIVIHEIANKTASDFEGGKGLTILEEEIQLKINEVMQDGEIVKVYTTSFLLQN